MEILEHPELTELLERLEGALDPAVEGDLERQWLDFWFAHDDAQALFRPKRLRTKVEALPVCYVNDTLADGDEGLLRMLLQQYAGALGALAGSAFPAVRANYGVGILACPFGTPLFRMERAQNTLPNVRPLGADGLRRILRGVPALDDELTERVFRVGALFAEIARRYPKIGRWVRPYHPDLQSPCDALELIVGSELFYLMVDEPEAVCEALDILTETYDRYLTRWLDVFPYNGRFSFHWGFMQRGAIMLRDDSAMNLSPEMYARFIAPYDGRLLRKHGGCVHFCGRGDHYLAQTAAQPGLFGIQMSQPALNDMERVYRCTVDRGIAQLAFPAEYAASAAARGVHGWVQI